MLNIKTPKTPNWLAQAKKILATKKVKIAAILVAFCLASALELAHIMLGATGQRAKRAVEMPYSAFLQLASQDATRISALRMSLSRFSMLVDGEPTFVRPVRAPSDLLWFLSKSGVAFEAAPTSVSSALLPLILPAIWLFSLWSLLRKQMTGATGSVGKRASRRVDVPENLTFDDVAGVDRAKEEVQEVVSMLRNPGRYAEAGARLPAGALMVGPPGTGKTLLARVMAAQAQVPFFYCSGSDFVELFVGRGAARMRSLFKAAAAAAPCIIFIDELDAIGKQRSLRLGGGSDEVEQTLNQMLACMDGLDSSNNGVVVMGATNRYEILDPALTRPGRFDRIVRIDLPDEEGRYSILKVHTRRLNLAPDVDLRRVALDASGFSGAELAGLANEAAIRSVRRTISSNANEKSVSMSDFTSALVDFTTSRRKNGLGILNSILPQ